MSVTYGFYNSLNGDRKYDAIQLSSLFDGLIIDGVFASIGTCFAVQADTGTSVNVGIGKAWFNRTWTFNDSILPMEAPISHVLLDRIDALVIEVNASAAVRANSIKFVQGTPSSQPVNPTLASSETVHQYPLAYIYRVAGSTEITQADITNMVGSASTPFSVGLNELFTFANDGKTAVANAVTAKGVPSSPSDTFSTLAGNIGKIGAIKSVQEGSILLSQPTSTITLGTVNPTNCVVLISAIADLAITTPANVSVKGEVTGSNTLTLSRITANTTAAYAVNVTWQVIEFDGVRSVQSGTMSIVSGSSNQSIGGVSSKKVLLFSTETNSSTQDTLTEYKTRLRLTFADHGIYYVVSLNAEAKGTGTKSISWKVIEFY